MRKRRLGIIATAVGLVGLAAGVASWASAGPRITAATELTVIEHATTDRVIDVGKAGDSTGDLLTFHNKVYDETDTEVVGSDQGTCVRMAPGKGTWECSWTTILEGGQITVEGPFYDAADSVVAVTGGTGIYDNVRGSMEIQSMEGGAKYAFVFSLIP